MDMPDLDIYNEALVNEQSLELQLCIQEKLEWRANYDYRVSIIKLDYVLRVLRIYWEGKHQISNPDGFKDKIKKLERGERMITDANGMSR